MFKIVAHTLWIKANHDFNAAAKIVDTDPREVGDQVFGMLLQQSVEKAIKALILTKNLKYDHTHDLHRLLNLLAKKTTVPEKIRELEDLTMFASQERYETPISDDKLNRPWLLDTVQEFLAWALEEGEFD